MVSFSLTAFPSCSRAIAAFSFCFSLSLSLSLYFSFSLSLSLSLCRFFPSIFFFSCSFYFLRGATIRTYIYTYIRIHVRLALLCLHTNLYMSWMVRKKTVLEKRGGCWMKKKRIEHLNCAKNKRSIILSYQVFQNKVPVAIFSAV